MAGEDLAGGHREGVVAVLAAPLLAGGDEVVLRRAATIRADNACITTATLLEHVKGLA